MRMIVIAGAPGPAAASLPLTAEERLVLMRKEQSPVTYRYASVEELVFELKGRTRVAEAAFQLHTGGAGFAVFANSRCNERYWTRTRDGGFRLRADAAPAEAVNDIFINGRLYAFECATAIVIIFYKAVLEMVGVRIFNRRFAGLFVRDWQHDRDLRLKTFRGLREAYLGDVLYFRNPDVNPAESEWQGENAVVLGDDRYFGHGIGFSSAETIIRALNNHRKPGAARSAYLTDEVLSIDYIHLYRMMKEDGGSLRPARGFMRPIFAAVGGRQYMALVRWAPHGGSVAAAQSGEPTVSG